MTINGRKTSVSALKNAKVVIETRNYIDFTSITKNFDDLVFADKQDTFVDFNVPANLISIKVSLSAQILNTTTKQMDKFSEQKTFDIETKKDTFCICELYLRMVKDNNFEVHCLGKNGEPQPNRKFTVEVAHSYLERNTQSLYTDDEGKLYLGKLNGCLTLTVKGEDSSLFQTWEIPKTRDFWSYPSVMNLIEGESFEIPVARMWNSKKPNDLLREQVSFYRSTKGVVIDDCFKKLTLAKKDSAESHYFLLQSHKLEAGDYTMEIRDLDNVPIQIKVVVHRGTFWKNAGNQS